MLAALSVQVSHIQSLNVILNVLLFLIQLLSSGKNKDFCKKQDNGKIGIKQ